MRDTNVQTIVIIVIILIIINSLGTLAGISSETIVKHSDISEEELLDLIDKLNTDHRVDGLLVQLPLPGNITHTHTSTAFLLVQKLGHVFTHILCMYWVFR